MTEGQQVGLSGATGNVTGPHLHFEIRTTPDYGSDVDPVAYLRSQGRLRRLTAAGTPRAAYHRSSPKAGPDPRVRPSVFRFCGMAGRWVDRGAEAATQ